MRRVAHRSQWAWILPLLGMAVLGAALLTIAEEAEEADAFSPPTKAEREAAVGALNGLAPALRRAFVAADDFQPIPAPGRRDWLTQFPEEGQTFAAYVASAPNRPDERRREVHLQPLGAFEGGAAPDLATLRRFAAAFFGLEVELRPGVAIDSVDITSRVNRQTGKPQLLTTDILEALKERLAPDAYCLLGVTMQDLYPDPRWNFVFGQASLRERVGVYSFVRYDPRFYSRAAEDGTEKLVLKRSCKVLAHEAGHMFGMLHCIHYLCLMNGSNHLAESDARPLHLCPVCLRKLHHAVGFDVAARYEKFLGFCRDAGFPDEVEWLEDRLVHLREKTPTAAGDS